MLDVVLAMTVWKVPTYLLEVRTWKAYLLLGQPRMYVVVL